MVRLSIPANLAFRDLLLRVISSSCKLVRHAQSAVQATGQESDTTLDDFESHVVSACGEAFNNLILHGYREAAIEPRIDVEIDISSREIVIRFYDWGTTFDPTRRDNTRPAEALPESHMGLYIMTAFMDDVSYRAGRPPDSPNVLSLTKKRAVVRIGPNDS